MPKNLYLRLPTQFFYRFFMGLVIGVACVTPGLSGGVIAAASGLYEPALHALVNLRRAFRRGCGLLIPLGLGGGLGVLLFSQIMRQLMLSHEHTVLYAFLGMVLGSVPALIKEGGRDGWHPLYLLVTSLGFLVAAGSGPLLRGLTQGAGTGAMEGADGLLAGGVFAFGTVIPGISASFILMAMGLYQPFLAAIADLQVQSLLWIGAGFFGVAALTVKLASWLFTVCRGPAYFAVIGLLLGSMSIAFPGIRTGWPLALDLALLSGGAAASWAVMRMQADG